MSSENVVSVIEVGTSRTVVLTGRARERGGPPEVLGVGVAPTTGLRKGRVLTRDYVRRAAAAAIAKAEEQARADIRDLALVCSCGDVAFEEPVGEAAAADPEGGLTAADAAAALAAMEKAAVPPDGREAFEPLRLYDTIDGDPAEVRDPEGMPGARLRTHGLLPHLPARHATALCDAVGDTGRDVNYLVFSGLAAARAVLARQQREDGALCIDFGAGTTSWCAYHRLHPVALGALPVGGDHVTGDLLAAFHPGSTLAAERFKVESCQCVLQGIAPEDRLPLHPDRGDPARTVSRHAAALVVNARMDELVRLVHDDLRRHGALRRLGAGIVLTGGGSRLAGLPDLVSRIFHAPCTIAALATGCPPVDADPARFAAAWGGLVQAVRKDERERAAAARRGGLFGRLGRLFEKEDRP